MTVWFVGFPTEDTSARRWWRAFTRPGYRHVLCWRQDGAGVLVINPLASTLEIARLERDLARFTAEMVLERKIWTLCLPSALVPPPPPDRPPLRLFLTCTEIVKHALGLRAWWCLTPRQLARLLRRRGALPVLPSIAQAMETRA
jgi:hypothetical protein